MANRHQLDSSHHHVAVIRNTCFQFQFKTLLLTLASVSLLISIQCASFGHRSVDQQQWQNSKPELYSGPNSDDTILNYLPYVVKQPAVEIDIDEQEQSPKNYYLTSPSNSASSPEDLDNFYQQLLLARQLATTSPETSPLSFDYSLSSNLDSSSNSISDNLDNVELSDYNAKLLERLFREDKKLSSSTDLSQNADDDVKNPFYFLPDQSSDRGEPNDKITLSYQDGHEESNTDGGKDKDNYKLSRDESQEGANDGGSLARDTKDNHKNLTTLLEDENVASTETSQHAEHATSPIPPVTTDKEGITVTPTVTEASYGSVVTGATELHDKITINKSSMSAMFNDFYNKLASYIPKFMYFSSSSGKPSKAIKTGEKDRTSEAKMPSGNGSHDNNTSDTDDDKQQTSKTDSEIRADSSMTMTSRTLIEPDDGTKDEDLDKLGAWSSDESINGDSNVISTESNKRQDTSVTHSDSATAINDAKASRSHNGGNGHKINMLRQSSVVLPLKANDELIIQSIDHTTHPDSLLGKYIYAPEHHYHLNAIPAHQPVNSKRVDIDDEQMYTQMSQRSYLRRLHPGDSVYSSYNGFSPLYESEAVGNHALNGIVSGNKTNDVYFLVMVAAFCAMAMAVVLAAGLFAYRVQQNRKATIETDYPTYGVVGPNNMNGKCGAASFVGGYFGSVDGPGSNSTGGSSKTGSVKQMADLYDNANVNGTKKAANEQSNGNFMANQNAAMYHYQHQKQQMIISDRASDSEDENDDENYTVYECPGLASAHEMEIKNPMFNHDQSP